MAKGNIITWALVGIVALLAAPSLIGLVRGPAETPGVFESGYSLEEATRESASAGKPMLVLVTADWCPPCQALKRGALRDERVAAWINSNTIPVYLEDGTDREAIASLPVKSYPTTLLIDDGAVVGSVVGNTSASSYLDALTDAVSGS